MAAPCLQRAKIFFRRSVPVTKYQHDVRSTTASARLSASPTVNVHQTYFPPRGVITCTGNESLGCMVGRCVCRPTLLSSSTATAYQPLRFLQYSASRPVLGPDAASVDIQSISAAQGSPLAKLLFKVNGVKGVFFGSDFITITKDDDDLDWQTLKPDIFAVIMDFFATDQPVIDITNVQGDVDGSVARDEDETVSMIRELIETRIRPTILDDGGDIKFMGFEGGIVKVKLMGACNSCPSSVVTLKRGVENMLQFYVPEVQGVLQVEDEIDDIAKKEFENFEKTRDSGGEKK